MTSFANVFWTDSLSEHPTLLLHGKTSCYGCSKRAQAFTGIFHHRSKTQLGYLCLDCTLSYFDDEEQAEILQLISEGKL